MKTEVRQAEVAQLLMQHRGALYAFIYSCVRNHSDAEDVLQSTTLAVMVSVGALFAIFLTVAVLYGLQVAGLMDRW